jgi:tRNA 2-thiouridine synthesizing protein A
MPAADHSLNALGLLCPLPLLFAVREMTTLEAGQVLEIVGDDPGLYEDVPAWCEKAGHRLLGFEEEEGVIMCWIEKGSASGTDSGTDPEGADAPTGEGPTGDGA